MDETTVTTAPEITAETVPLETVPVSDQGFDTGFVVLPYSTEPEETIAMTTEPVYLEAIQNSAADIVHADLFGSFLICGTLVGIFLLRGKF